MLIDPNTTPKDLRLEPKGFDVKGFKGKITQIKEIESVDQLSKLPGIELDDVKRVKKRSDLCDLSRNNGILQLASVTAVGMGDVKQMFAQISDTKSGNKLITLLGRLWVEGQGKAFPLAWTEIKKSALVRRMKEGSSSIGETIENILNHLYENSAELIHKAFHIATNDASERNRYAPLSL